jgi:Subtilase family
MPSPVPRWTRWVRPLVGRPIPAGPLVASDVGLPQDTDGSASTRQLRYLHLRSDCYRLERTSCRLGIAPTEDLHLFARRTAYLFCVLDSVLTVGAMDAQGKPLETSNLGGLQGIHVILAPGVDRLGAQPGGGTARGTGTSYATTLVSGVAALLLNLQRKRGRPPSPRLAREALSRSTLGCLGGLQRIAAVRWLDAGASKEP